MKKLEIRTKLSRKKIINFLERGANICYGTLATTIIEYNYLINKIENMEVFSHKKYIN